MNAHRNVCGYGHFENYTVTTAVFGHVSNAVSDGIARSAYFDALPINQDVAGVGWSDAKENPGQFGAACADQAGEAKDFAGANLKGDVCNVGGATGEVSDG
jgi:hypothetical protein